MAHVTPVAAFSDNYIWLAAATANSHAVIIVDPGDARPVRQALTRMQLTPCAILVTHCHYDHIDGIADLCQHYSLPVYGPANPSLPELSHPVADNEEIELSNGLRFRVIAVPGHTADHVAYYTAGSQPGILFCGDTLFAAGCGRLMGGTAKQLYESLQTLAALPDDTLIYCTHEYTLANLKFAAMVEPDNHAITSRIQATRQLLTKTQCSLPSTLRLEKLTNPFLRCDQATIRQSVNQFADKHETQAAAIFKILRYWKDTF